MFPNANVARVDSDVMTKKTEHIDILDDFSNGKTDILIGTQMIAKGLNFPDVRLVGVICADVVLNNGDFRVRKNFNSHTIYRGDNTNIEKHIPLLKASGLANEIDPIDIFTSLEEYFSLEKQSKERTESVGITDKEKAENHGFDSKASFRK